MLEYHFTCDPSCVTEKWADVVCYWAGLSAKGPRVLLPGTEALGVESCDCNS